MQIRCAVVLSFVVVIGLGLSGCGGGLPTEAQAKAGVIEDIQPTPGVNRYDNANAIKVLSIHKTNGLASEYEGVKEYKMAFECEIEFTRDCWWDTYAQFGGGGSFTTYDSDPYADLEKLPPDARASIAAAINKDQFKHVKAGQHEIISGACSFKLTENGWGYRNGTILLGKRALEDEF